MAEYTNEELIVAYQELQAEKNENEERALEYISNLELENEKLKEEISYLNESSAKEKSFLIEKLEELERQYAVVA